MLPFSCFLTVDKVGCMMQQLRRKAWRIERRPTPRLVKEERRVHSNFNLHRCNDVLVGVDE